MPHDHRRLKSLFQAALDVANPAAQAAYLAEACPDDPNLRDRVVALLKAHAEAGAFLTSEAGPIEREFADFVMGETAVLPAGAHLGGNEPAAQREVQPTIEIPSLVGTTIAGRYKVRQEIGEGGMGTVYMAEQVQPVKRMVALKLIRAGMNSRSVLARFESERQALALMSHPHIARVLDAGTTVDGHPFFVMDLVRGIPLTDYCDQHHLDLRGRLNLFRQICVAVQHAHQKGIIHRDLKPKNILIEDHDGEAVPKVIDFGLAKAISGLELTEQSMFTAFGSITGTPLYMAPEQATFNAIDIDTRADIYALGVILYELLTDSTPIRKESLQKSALEEMLRIIREDEPPIPSQRISDSEKLPNPATNRQVERVRLSRFVRGDLDWIVMKALAKERVRRYDSAIGLAHDVERFLNNEPVLAGPPTAWYRTSKFIRRNRGRVIAASLVSLVLVGGIIGTTLGLVEARSAALAKEEARQDAERRLTQLGKINAVIVSIFTDINPRNAETEGKPLAALLGERLVQAATQIEGESIGDPPAVARTQLVLAQSLMGLGYPDKAIDLLINCRETFANKLGQDHPETLASLTTLADAYQAAGQLDHALALLEQVSQGKSRKLGPDHPDTLSSLAKLAETYRQDSQPDRALSLLEEVLKRRRAKLGPDHPETLASAHNLGVAYNAAGRLDRAIPLIEQALEGRSKHLGPDHTDTLANMGTLAVAYSANGQPDRSVDLLVRAVDALIAKLGPEHPDTLYGMGCLSTAYRVTRQHDKVVPLQQKIWEARKAKLGSNHPDTLVSLHDLAAAQYDIGKKDLAIPLFMDALERRRTKLGSNHPATLATMGTLAVIYRANNQLDLAIPMLNEVWTTRSTILGSDHYDTLMTMTSLAVAYQLNGEKERAIELFEQALLLRRLKLGPDHPTTLVNLNKLILAYHDVGQPARIEALCDDFLRELNAKLGPNDPRMLRSLKEIALSLQKSDRFDRAGLIWESIINRYQESVGKDHPDTLAARLGRVDLDLARERLDLAEPAYRAILTDCRSKLGENHPVTVRVEKTLADLLNQRGAGTEATQPAPGETAKP